LFNEEKVKVIQLTKTNMLSIYRHIVNLFMIWYKQLILFV